MVAQYSDFDNIRDATYGLFATLEDSDKTKLNELYKGRLVYQKEVSDVALLTTVPEHAMLRHDQNILVTGGWFICSELPTTSNDINYAYFRMAWRDAATGLTVTIITEHATTVANGNIELWKPYRINLTAPSANWFVPAGSTLTFETKKLGLGIILGKGLVILEYKLV